MKTALLTALLVSFFMQYSATAQQTFNCKNLIRTDSITYEKFKKIPEKISSTTSLKKTKGTINIPHLKRKFSDREEEMEYTVVGKVNNYTLISGDDYIQTYYYLIGKQKIDTLTGPPKIFGKILLAIEEDYTDFPETIQIWDISANGTLKLKETFSIKNCKNKPIADAYISENTLYIKTGHDGLKHDFYRLKIQ